VEPDEPGLFEEPPRLIPPEPPALTRGERRRRLVATRIATGVHPLGRPVMLHPQSSRDPEDHVTGPRCGGCIYRQLVKYHDLKYHDRTRPKCWYPGRGGGVADDYPHPRDTNCESSDIRKWWPACREFEAK